MNSHSPDRVRTLVTSLAIDEEHAADLVELIHLVSDAQGDQVHYGLALKAMKCAYLETEHCHRGLDSYLETFEMRLAS